MGLQRLLLGFGVIAGIWLIGATAAESQVPKGKPPAKKSDDDDKDGIGPFVREQMKKGLKGTALRDAIHKELTRRGLKGKDDKPENEDDKEGIGAFVRQQIKNGVLGPDLAAAIQKELARRGMKGKGGDEKSPGKAQPKDKGKAKGKGKAKSKGND